MTESNEEMNLGCRFQTYRWLRLQCERIKESCEEETLTTFYFFISTISNTHCKLRDCGVKVCNRKINLFLPHYAIRIEGCRMEEVRFMILSYFNGIQKCGNTNFKILL